jgi:hypothetical protein
VIWDRRYCCSGASRASRGLPGPASNIEYKRRGHPASTSCRIADPMQVFDSLPERQLWGHWLTPRSTAAMVRSGATLRRPAHKADRPLFSGKTTFAGVSSLDGLAPKAVIPTAAPDMRGSNVGRSRSIRFGEVRIPPSVTRIDGIVVRDHACCSGIQAAVCNRSPYANTWHPRDL